MSTVIVILVRKKIVKLNIFLSTYVFLFVKWKFRIFLFILFWSPTLMWIQSAFLYQIILNAAFLYAPLNNFTIKKETNYFQCIKLFIEIFSLYLIYKFIILSYFNSFFEMTIFKRIKIILFRFSEILQKPDGADLTRT